MGVSVQVDLGKEGLLKFVNSHRPYWALFECLVKNKTYDPISYLIEVEEPIFFQNGFEADGSFLSLITGPQSPTPKIQGMPQFQGGLWVLFSYELSGVLEPYLRGKIRRSEFPIAILFEPREFLAYHFGDRTLFVMDDNDPGPPASMKERYQDRKKRLWERLERLLGMEWAHEFDLEVPLNTTIEPLMGRERFESTVRELRDAIVSGECIQVVLSQRFSLTNTRDPLVAYAILRDSNPSPYSCIMRCEDFYLVAASPEMLIRAEGENVTLRPIAGTRARAVKPHGDHVIGQELLNDPKELAEHMMLLDLGRNDLGKVCSPGSVKVTQKATLEYYLRVIHLVSEVRGKLRSGLSVYNLIRATFPAGTVTGAPKLRAMELIELHEPLPRGPYAGCFGLIGRDGFVDLGITIRAAFGWRNNMFVQAGAGIVLDSRPDREYEETINKAMAVLESLGASSKKLL